MLIYMYRLLQIYSSRYPSDVHVPACAMLFFMIYWEARANFRINEQGHVDRFCLQIQIIIQKIITSAFKEYWGVSLN